MNKECVKKTFFNLIIPVFIISCLILICIYSMIIMQQDNKLVDIFDYIIFGMFGIFTFGLMTINYKLITSTYKDCINNKT